MEDLVSKLLEAFSFSKKRQQIVELILQEYRPGEIAELMQVSTRTVLRTRKEAEKAILKTVDNIRNERKKQTGSATCP